MPISNVLDWMSLHGAQMLYPPGWDCSSFTPTLFLSVESACVRTQRVCLASFAPFMCLGPCLCVKSVGGNLQVVKIRRDIPKSRQKIDSNDDCKRTTASRRPVRTRPTVGPKVPPAKLSDLLYTLQHFCDVPGRGGGNAGCFPVTG